MMGPHLPCGSIAIGISTIFAVISSPMVCSPGRPFGNSVSGLLLERMNFLRSIIWRCLSAAAEKKEMTFPEESKVEGASMQWVTVMSAPIVVYGQGVCVVEQVIGSGSKLKSKGCAEISEMLRFLLSMSSFDVGRMYPAVASAGCSAVANESRIILWTIFLLIFRQ